MNQTIIVNTYIHKGTKLGDVGHDARHNHALLQILNRLDGSIKLKFLHLATRVQSWLVQLSHDISQGRHTHLLAYILLDIYLLLQSLVLHELLHRHALIFRHRLYQRIAFWMHGTVIKRILGTRNTQETSTLLVSRRTQTRHLLQLGTRGEGTILPAILHDILGKRRPQTTHIGQQML